jgi:hypothetical protein
LQGYQDTWDTCRLHNLSNCNGEAYGSTIIAGWEIFGYPSDLRRVRLVATDVKVFDDMEGENGDGEYNLDLVVGPSSALGGDILAQTNSVALQDINTGLNDAAGNGESYDLKIDGKPLTLLFNVRDNPQATESNFVGFRLEAFEDDPIWDDDIPTTQRAFYATSTFSDNVYPPTWAGCGLFIPSPTCDYGEENYFGTVRGSAAPPIPYEDGVPHPDSRTVGDYVLSLGYNLELLPAP